jgi:two-component system repressor protein LuxO
MSGVPQRTLTPGGAGDDARALLLIEDTPSLQMVYRSVLAAAGFAVQVASTAAEGMQLFSARPSRIVLLDLLLPDGDGIQLLDRILARAPETCVVVMTAHGSIDRAVAAMRAGAHDFLLKPFEEQRFLSAMRAAADEAARRAAGAAAPIRRSRGAAAEPADPTGFIGTSEAMAQVHRTIGAVARSMATVFITGESGTGKELAALAVHARSSRAQGPFIALNCGAIPPDLLESEVFGHMKGSFTGAISDKPGAAAAADGGTLFLDEICEMAPALQTKLLRFLQTSTVQPVGAVRPRKVNVRIICATNRDPVEAVRRGQFREDLFYRLYVVPIHMPPLRERGHDAVEIAAAALERFAAEEGRRFEGLAPETEAFLMAQDWPGNVRQLLNVIRNTVVLNEGGVITPAMLPLPLQSLADPLRADPLRADPFRADPLRPDAPVHGLPRPALPEWTASQPALAGKTLAEIERAAIDAALARHGGSVSRAARELDISPSTLYRKLEAWGRGVTGKVG